MHTVMVESASVEDPSTAATRSECIRPSNRIRQTNAATLTQVVTTMKPFAGNTLHLVKVESGTAMNYRLQRAFIARKTLYMTETKAMVSKRTSLSPAEHIVLTRPIKKTKW